MLVPFVPPLRGRRRRTRRKPSAPPPPVALTLVSASYDDTIPRLTLEFDRAVNITAYNGNAVIVDDGPNNGTRYDGGGGISLIDPAIVQIELVEVQASASVDVLLNASAASGIAAVNDGGTWPGVSNLLLPFP